MNPVIKRLLIALTSCLSLAAHADTQIQFSPAEVTGGAQLSWLQCPCLRWVTQFQAANGTIETGDFLISLDSLLNFRQESTMDLQRQVARLFNIGAVEALWKGGHMGLGFSGFSWGEDDDLGYSDIFKTGLYALADVVRTQSLRLDLHSGVDVEAMRVNLGPDFERTMLDQSARLRWKSGRWSGDVTAYVGLDAHHAFDSSYMREGASASVQARVFDLQGVRASLGFDTAYSYDAFREQLGLEPDLVTGMLFMDLSYVASNGKGAGL